MTKTKGPAVWRQGLSVFRVLSCLPRHYVRRARAFLALPYLELNLLPLVQRPEPL